MNEEVKSKIKYAIIMSLIGLIISLVFLIFEIVTKGDIIFWAILSSCNLVLLLANIISYKKEK